YNGKWYALGKKKEVFAIKGSKPIEKIIYYAGRKPVLTEVFKDLGFDVSLDWTGFDEIDFQGFFMMNAAKNFDEFMEGAKHIRISPQNVAYADDQGNIAFRVIGSLPLRKKGTGNIIQDGEKVICNWEGNIPDDKYPMIKNPQRGYIATANNLNVKDYPYALNATYAPGYRYENIARMLRGKKNLDVEYMKTIQTDTHTVLAGKIKNIVKKYVSREKLEEYMKRAYDMLMQWDGNSSRDSVAASIYNTFYVRFAYQTLVDELGDEVATEYVSERYISMERFFEMVKTGSVFFDDTSTQQKETIGDIATRAFTETCILLEDIYGTKKIEKWQWGQIHKIKFDHVLGKSSLFRPLVNYGPFPFEGDGETNCRAKFLEVVPPFIADLASAPRIIVMFNPHPSGYMMLITGENEHFMSKHNTDMVDAWLAHEYFSMQGEKATYSMKLVPAKF
ncbi:MAG: penicillin acylase family protein, partial [Spirochaetota bacterium]